MVEQLTLQTTISLRARNEEEFVKHIVKSMAQNMMKDFPEVTREVINDILSKR
jgi:hypothetical protein